MKVERENNGNLSIIYDGTRLSILSLGVFVAALVWLAFEYVNAGSGTERFQGLVGTSITFLLIGIIFWEKSEFRFDAGRKELLWKKARYFRYRSGRIHFSDIKAIIIGSPVGDEGLPSRRIELIMKQETLPITTSYKSYKDEFILTLTSELKELVGLRLHATPEERAKELQELGRIVEAVKVLTKESGMSVTEAKQYLRK